MTISTLRMSLCATVLMVPLSGYGSTTLMDDQADQDSSEQDFAISDGQAVGILSAAISVAIETSKIAQSHAQKATVKSFADNMVRDSQALSAKLDQLGLRAKISGESTSLQARRVRNLTALKLADDAEFDKVYMRQQLDLAYHLSEVIDSKLLPAVQNAQLKDLLTQTRAALMANSNQAAQIIATL